MKVGKEVPAGSKGAVSACEYIEGCAVEETERMELWEGEVGRTERWDENEKDLMLSGRVEADDRQGLWINSGGGLVISSAGLQIVLVLKFEQE